MKSRCTIEVEFSTAKSAKSAEQAISHEKEIGNRSSANIGLEGKEQKTLRIDIEAKDVVALRATMNAFMRAVQTFEGISESIKDNE